ncbi:hypothetical protein FRC04_005349 [Tulasnella sp. 424]|nr:hypothetical protein FRC04_005349 [Tulasnella sp. 424]
MTTTGESLEFELGGAQNFVAVKKLKIGPGDDKEKMLRAFASEAGIMAKLSHPNIVRLEAFVEDAEKDVFWLVLPWEPNGNLREFILSEDCKLEVPELSSLQNILVNSEYSAVITDFGSARIIRDVSKSVSPNTTSNPASITGTPQAPLEVELDSATRELTITGCLFTTRWAAPEILFDGKPELASDVWAFGWICWEIDHIRPRPKGEIDSKIRSPNLLLKLAWLSVHNEDEILAGEYFKQALSIFSLTGDAGGTAASYYGLGITHRNLSNFSVAAQYFQEALENFGEVDFEWGETLIALGEVQCAQGEYMAAISSFTNAQTLSALIGHHHMMAQAWLCLGHVHLIQSDYTAATSSLNNALKICNQQDAGPNRLQAIALCELGLVHTLQSDYESAPPLYKKALEIYSKLGEQSGKARALFSLGDVQKGSGDYEGALSSYREAQEIFKQRGCRANEGITLQGLGEVHHLQGQYAIAMSFYVKARAICRQVGSKLNGTNILYRMASIDRAEQRYEVALERFEEAKTTYMEMNLPQLVSNCEAEIIEIRQEIKESG